MSKYLKHTKNLFLCLPTHYVEKHVVCPVKQISVCSYNTKIIGITKIFSHRNCFHGEYIVYMIFNIVQMVKIAYWSQYTEENRQDETIRETPSGVESLWHVKKTNVRKIREEKKTRSLSHLKVSKGLPLGSKSWYILWFILEFRTRSNAQAQLSSK